MSKKFQITQVGANGSTEIMHPETNADLVKTGATYKVPAISDINNWSSRGAELIEARKGEVSLKAKIDKIDNSITAKEMLLTLKTVDGAGSGLDADLVDGCGVSDTQALSNNLWTAQKTSSELNKKIDGAEVVGTATPNKLLRLNNSSLLPTGITGNSATSNRLLNPVLISVDGDVTGQTSLRGDEGSVNLTLSVKDDSHTHSRLGDVSVNDNLADNKSLWTALKTTNELLKLDKKVKDDIDGLVSTDNNEINIGGITIRYGSVSIANKNIVTIDFGTTFSTVLFNGHCCETSDKDLVTNVQYRSLTNSEMKIILNRAATNGSITWFVVGV